MKPLLLIPLALLLLRPAPALSQPEPIPGNDRVEDLVVEMIAAAKGQVTPNGGLERVDFDGPIRDRAHRYGLEPARVQEQIDRWIAEVVQTPEDLYRQGLAAIAQTRFGEAERLLARSAEAKEKRLARQPFSGDASALLETAVRDLRLAGDCAFADYRFADAGNHYRAALSLLDRAVRPGLSAATLYDLGTANVELAIRASTAEAPAHLTKALDALQAALALQSLEATPLAWTRTQAMLLRVYEDQGDAAGMAAVVAELLSAEPDNREFYKLAHTLSHEVLFDFANAHRLTLAWLERYPDDMDALCNLAETHFTNGQFDQAAKKLQILLDSGQLPPAQEAAMRLVEIADRLAMGQTNAVRTRLDVLRTQVEAQPEDFTIGWTFEGSSHFIGQHPALDEHRGMLFGLLWAAETGKRDALLAAIDKASAAVGQKP